MPRQRTNTSDQLIEVAEKHFAERGYEAASLNDIAAEVGIRTPSLYSHFRNKRALYEAVFERRLAPLFELFSHRGIFPTDAAETQTLIREVMLQLCQHPNLARLIQYAVLAGGESVTVLMDKVYRPLFAMTQESLGDLPEEERRHQQLVFTAFHSMIFGFFTFAPVYGEMMGADVVSSEISAAQTTLLESLAAEL